MYSSYALRHASWSELAAERAAKSDFAAMGCPLHRPTRTSPEPPVANTGPSSSSDQLISTQGRAAPAAPARSASPPASGASSREAACTGALPRRPCFAAGAARAVGSRGGRPRACAAGGGACSAADAASSSASKSSSA